LDDRLGHHPADRVRHLLDDRVRDALADRVGDALVHDFLAVGRARDLLAHGVALPHLPAADRRRRLAVAGRLDRLAAAGAAAGIEAALAGAAGALDPVAGLAVRLGHPLAALLGDGLVGADRLADGVADVPAAGLGALAVAGLAAGLV